jgi:hypothetical protein
VAGNGNALWLTVSGIALEVEIDWPYRPSTSGADFWTVHAKLRPVGKDGQALVAVNVSATLRDVLPSLERQDSESTTMNVLRKEVDGQQVEFLKSAKLVPVQLSSRYFSVKRKVWTFHTANGATVAEFLKRKVYWQSRGSAGIKVQIDDAVDAQYLGVTVEALAAAAQQLAASGLVTLDGSHARATPALMTHAAEFEAAQERALEALEEKHAFERG